MFFGRAAGEASRHSSGIVSKWGTMDDKLRNNRDRVAERCGGGAFDLAVLLGSGLGEVADAVREAVVIPYEELSVLPRQLVSGHAGRLVAGRFGGWRALFFQGRFHCYQGYSARHVAEPVRLAHALGCRRLVLTNAAGGIAPGLAPGDFLYLGDHINLLGDNPLRGESDRPFIDLTSLYENRFFAPLQSFAAGQGIRLSRGVLAAVPGPSYETPAEVRALHLLGADAVSMSIVPEAILARYLDMAVVALSFIANPAAGLGDHPLSHQEVLETGRRGAGQLRLLLVELVRLWQSSD
jgi:purine-nucleoside phosphorylase